MWKRINRSALVRWIRDMGNSPGDTVAARWPYSAYRDADDQFPWGTAIGLACLAAIPVSIVLILIFR